MIEKEKEEQEYAYLVEHPEHGTRIFYVGGYYGDTAGAMAVDYAENIVIVFKIPLYSQAYVHSLSTEFSNVVKSIELPSIPVESMLCNMG